MDRAFQKLAQWAAAASGTSWAFVLAVLMVVGWAATGPLFRFSATWQLVINTGTTIVTFLMVFLIQNSQNRDTKAMHLKLDELLRSVEGAQQGKFIDLEDRTDAELDQLKERMVQECDPGESAAEHARHSPVRARKGRATTAGTVHAAPQRIGGIGTDRARPKG
jgi:low affinity Fe/Cu permease